MSSDTSSPQIADAEILHLSAIEAWITACYGTKVLMTGYDDWAEEVENKSEDPDRGDFILGSFLKRIYNWHNEVYGTLTKEFMSPANMPRYVKEVVDMSSEDRSVSPPDPFTLHLDLILKASDRLIECIAELDISKKTITNIATWFEMLDNAKFLQYLKASRDYEKFKEQIDVVTFKYQSTKDDVNTTIGSGRDFPFFDPRSLLMFLTNVVFMKCYDPAYVTKSKSK